MASCNETHPTLKRGGYNVRCVLEKGHDGAHRSKEYKFVGEVPTAYDAEGNPTQTEQYTEPAVDQWI